jgi:hypothetical protein
MSPIRTIGPMLSALLLISVLSPDAEARSRHGARGSHAHNSTRMDNTQDHHARSARSRRTGTTTRLDAAAADADRLLNTRIKSICRGC